ncbi:hydroxysqualene dehydroxylase HpnE [Methyloversatilis discipulorum]|uniref:hydroxysqualene dehydroxylase HpnE n=1 Tax=Methyloversatilis discipulorum TaxID=1119528 RepID=UPI001A3799FA|nr:hydroxysqualene dehydroxylase HpnE [Methyloversatilis discipulorum]MBL8468984.1 FAD-dependent oxidoreductase [Methyloversatilis discipulorum]
MSTTVAIVGGGWAGLACAVDCVRRGLRPTVFEAAPQVGGRARTVRMDGLPLDNGQHILIGAYSETLALMRAVGADPETLLQRLPLALEFDDGFSLRAHGSGRASIALAFLRAHGMSWRDRLAALRLMRAIRRAPLADETVAALLARTAQTDGATRHLWAPLCVAALNTSIEQSSARVFARVLTDSLMGPPGAADLLLPRADLGSLLPEPALFWLRAHGASVNTGTRVRTVREQADGFAIDCGDSAPSFDRVVFACSPHQLPALLGDLPDMEDIARQVAALEYEAITTVYASFDARTRLPAAMTGFVAGEPHWVFDRGQLGGPPGLLASVVSAAGGTREETERTVLSALRSQFPSLSDPLWVRTISERRATFRCTPGRAAIEQPRDTRIALAGDYLVADYPATLEAAVRSSLAAASRVAGASRKTQDSSGK